MDMQHRDAFSLPQIRASIADTLRDLEASTAFDNRPHQLALATYALQSALDETHERRRYVSGLGPCLVHFAPDPVGPDGMLIFTTTLNQGSSVRGFDIAFFREEPFRSSFYQRHFEVFRMKILVGSEAVIHAEREALRMGRDPQRFRAATGPYTESPIALAAGAAENFQRAAGLGLAPDPEALARYVCERYEIYRVH